jgi:hypothetical protein
MHMSVHHSLACRDAIIKTDVESIGSEIGEQPSANLRYQLPDRALLSHRKFVDGSHMLAWKNERVAFTHRIRITDGHRVLRFNPEAFGLDEAKWAGTQAKSIPDPCAKVSHIANDPTVSGAGSE